MVVFIKKTCLAARIIEMLVIVCSMTMPGAAAAAPKTAIKDAIVKIYTVSSQPDYFHPWRMRGTSNSVGSGCVISGRRILTNAHVVANHTFIQVRRYGEAKRYRAYVLRISHDADLALLKVEDESFFTGITPLEFGELPETQQEVVVYGFPVGGDSLSITKGVLSRVEHLYYTHSSLHFLAGQIDAAINPGNSGGPVLVDGKIGGVVMQVHKANYSENLGYMVPMPIITHFLDDMADGKYHGFPDLGLVVQDMESPDMKRKYGMTEEQTGVFVVQVLPGSPAEGLLQEGDIILALAGRDIADDATVEFRPKERTYYTHYVDIKQLGEPLELTILRDKTVTDITVTLDQTSRAYQLVPSEQYEQLPRYFIYGGIVFCPLTKNLLKRWGSKWPTKAPSKLVAELSNWVTEERQEVVVALKILAADVNTGYHEMRPWIVASVNDTSISTFDQFVRLVTQATTPYVIFKNERGFQIVIDREKAAASHADILQTYHIEHDRSPDLR